jgi:hypothetical protein
MVELADILRKEMVKYLVQKEIFCPITQKVLDMDTCVVVNDKDGDPALVLTQDGWTQLLEVAERRGEAALAGGYAVDVSTVRS